MRLPLSLMLETLEERFSLSLPRPAGDRLLALPVPLSGDDAPRQDRLYLSAVPCPSREAEGCCILYTDGASPVSDHGSSFSVPRPMAEVQRCLYSLWEDISLARSGVEEQVFAGSSLQELSGAMREQLRNPFVIFGWDFSLRAQSGLELLPVDWNIFDEQNGNTELFAALRMDILSLPGEQERTPRILPARVLPCRTLHHSIVVGDREEHIVLLELERPFRSADGWLLVQWESCIRFLLEKENLSQEDSGARSILQQLLFEKGADYQELSQELTRLGWGSEELYQCLLLSAGRAGAEVPARLGTYLERTMPCCCLSVEGQLVTILRFRTTDEADELHSRLKVFIRENFLKAGYSRVVPGHENLRRQYVQSRAALELGRQKSPYTWIHRFDDLAFDYLLEQLAHAMPGGLLCHRGVLRLQQHDREHGTEYIRTLRTLLDTNMNVVQASRELFIHRSTLLYRLDRIRQLLEGSLNDPAERDYLSLSLRLLELEQKE